MKSQNLRSWKKLKFSVFIVNISTAHSYHYHVCGWLLFYFCWQADAKKTNNFQAIRLSLIFHYITIASNNISSNFQHQSRWYVLIDREGKWWWWCVRFKLFLLGFWQLIMWSDKNIFSYQSNSVATSFRLISVVSGKNIVFHAYYRWNLFAFALMLHIAFFFLLQYCNSERSQFFHIGRYRLSSFLHRPIPMLIGFREKWLLNIF